MSGVEPKGQGPSVQCAVQERVATVTISNPPRFNAMTRAMWRDLKAVFEGIQAEAGLRLVVLAGEGQHFCAGGDISEYPDFRFDPVRLREFHEDEVWGGLQAMLACDVPIAATIRGNCMGAGVEMASCCDVRLSERSARFGAPIAKLGFPMAPREAQLVAGALGEATAREMLLTGAILDAPEMAGRGFLQHLVEPDRFGDAVEQLVKQVGALSPQAARLNKQTLRALQAGRTMDDILRTAYDYAASAEHREGISSFLEKRPAKFG
ncbi:enoyl-CoA hydratase-related protein [Hydrogenophaga sp. 5NK40-0174]|uniref:enoyl-CoA hydratase/isomerase family protein n=1 Tax=Hydrogenophaga sp. 5NK40-0174 TaxID=3127649 RepID=UPI003108E393